MRYAVPAIASIVGLLLAGDAVAADCVLPAEAQPGRLVSNQCKSCHLLAADKPSRPTGPNLHDVYGSIAGGREDFRAYSEGIKGARDIGITWNDGNLFDYMGDPKAFLDKVNGKAVKQTMLFQLRDGQKRKDLIAFLKAIKGKPECN